MTLGIVVMGNEHSNLISRYCKQRNMSTTMTVHSYYGTTVLFLSCSKQVEDFYSNVHKELEEECMDASSIFICLYYVNNL